MMFCVNGTSFLENGFILDKNDCFCWDTGKFADDADAADAVGAVGAIDAVDADAVGAIDADSVESGCEFLLNILSINDFFGCVLLADAVDADSVESGCEFLKNDFFGCVLLADETVICGE
jgi:hypothetical protein